MGEDEAEVRVLGDAATFLHGVVTDVVTRTGTQSSR